MRRDVVKAWISDLQDATPLSQRRKRKPDIDPPSTRPLRPHKVARKQGRRALRPTDPNIPFQLNNNREEKPSLTCRRVSVAAPQPSDRPMSSLHVSPTRRSGRLNRTPPNPAERSIEDVFGVIPDPADENPAEETPRPRKGAYPTALSRCPELVRRPSLPSSNTSSTSHRSRSPVKKVTGLRDIEGGIVYADFSHNIDVLGEGGKQLHRALTMIADKVSFLPAAISDQIEAAESGLCIYDHQKDITDSRTQEELLSEMRQLQNINRLSRRCVRMAEGEAEWNNAVHSALLRLALQERAITPDAEPVGMRYITNVKLDSRYLPKDASGYATASKVIDYVLFLGEDDDEVNDESDNLPSPRLTRQISRLISGSTESINHVSYFGLRHRPIAVGVETKTISRSEEEARVQLGIWVAAHIQRVRALAEEHGLDPHNTVDPILSRMVFPLLYVNTDSWTVFFARPSLLGDGSAVRTYIYKGLYLGNSSSLVGAYQILRGLGRLRAWVESVFKGWWHEIVDELGDNGLGGADDMTC